MTTYVVDASAVLALLHDEEGAETVERLVEEEDTQMSAVNFSEVVQKSIARGVDVHGLRGELEALGIPVEPFTAEDAETAAELWEKGRSVGLSLGDRACLALTLRLEGTSVTTDRAWRKPKLGVELLIVR